MQLLKKFKYESKLKTVEWSELRISRLTASRVCAQWTVKWHVSHLALPYVPEWDKYHGHEPQRHLDYLLAELLHMDSVLGRVEISVQHTTRLDPQTHHLCCL